MLRIVLVVLVFVAICKAANNTTVAVQPSATQAAVSSVTTNTTTMAPTKAKTAAPTSGAIEFAPTFFLLALSAVFTAVARL